uniref:Putative secreted protein n=1 Tax=Ixodes ricinus TaxID=34613 RepID=A0A6B0URD7_IXORI
MCFRWGTSFSLLYLVIIKIINSTNARWSQPRLIFLAPSGCKKNIISERCTLLHFFVCALCCFAADGRKYVPTQSSDVTPVRWSCCRNCACANLVSTQAQWPQGRRHLECRHFQYGRKDCFCRRHANRGHS